MPAERRWSGRTAASVAGAMMLAAVLMLAHCGTSGKNSPAPASASAPATARAPASGPALASGPASARAADPVPARASASAAAVASAAPPATTPKRQAYVIAAIGDSLTDYASHGGGYLRYIEKRCPESRIDNFGKGGFMVNQMRRRFFTELLPKHGPYTHLVVFGGVNDLYSDLTAGRTPEKISADLAAMYAAGRERGMRIIALTVAPWGGFRRYYNPSRAAATRRVNDWIVGQLQARAVDHVVDAYALLSCGDPERLCPRYEMRSRDGLHLGPEGQEQLGAALYEQAFRDCR